MPITVYFPDLLGIYGRSSLIAYQGILWVGGSQLVIHYFHAFFLWIFKPLMPYFNDILSNPEMGWNPTWRMLITFINHPEVFRTLFLFKVPYLIFDLGCAFLLLGIFQNQKKGLNAFIFWMVNPIVIFATYIAARYECICIFFILLSFYYAKNNMFIKSLLFFGGSIVIRLYPLILLPFFIIILGKNVGEYLKLAFWGLLPLGTITVLDKLFHRVGEIGGAMGMHQANYLLTMKFYMGHLKDYIFIFVAAYGFLLLYTHFTTDHSFENLRKSLLMLMLLFFATCFFHAHYFMWLIPFLTLQIVEDRRFIGLFIIQVICFIVYTFQWKETFANLLFTPLNPSYFMSLRTPFEIINQYYPIANFIGIFRSIFSGVSLYMIYLVFKSSFPVKKEAR